MVLFGHTGMLTPSVVESAPLGATNVKLMVVRPIGTPAPTPKGLDAR